MTHPHPAGSYPAIPLDRRTTLQLFGPGADVAGDVHLHSPSRDVAGADANLAALAAQATQPRAPVAAHRRGALVARWGPHALPIAVIALLAAALVAVLPGDFQQDSWLGLAAGRLIWHDGLPHHEVLTAWAHGKSWVDQQWLAQLTMYALFKAGGLRLVGLVHVALTMSGIAGAILVGRRLGVGERTLLLIVPPCAFLAIAASQEVRTQSYAYPLFVAVLYLLASDSRAPSRRVYLCLGLLVLWANLHGSASLGAGLVALAGLAAAWERRAELTRTAAAWGKPLALGLGGPLCLLATPYGVSAASYYHDTLFNGSFRKLVTEWQPITAAPVLAVPFFLLFALGVWSLGRHQGRTTRWERAALLLLGIGAITAVRNVAWFALAAIVLVALSVDQATRVRESSRPSRPHVNLALAALALVAVVALAGKTLAKGDGSFETQYPRGVLAAVRTATAHDRSITVLADAKFADWLLWHEPALAGRVAYDARFELLTHRQLDDVLHVTLAVGSDWKRIARGYRLVVLSTEGDSDAPKAFAHEPGGRVLYRRHDSLVVLRSPAEAAA